ncbi:pyrroline-5-carboxylate reductase [Candidatus Methylospira mobilis]|uniref:pyrroline-5-carboxylate reductase n=1 Tax=Candidatus Methylospira mobilis TaxID=1808979 RepID=UPI0028E4EA2F|nr:pyrroline-5-carboxylate reductase [Candidatus Methylospira mobilis]WNV04845.1 pyrroline-5-carboxylate reductase [Candidatus Methylospira mobilis]
MKQQKLGFIGAGNMAGSLIAGLIADGYAPANIWVSDPNQDKREQFSASFGIHTTPDNNEVVNQARLVVLAVKPQVLRYTAQEIAAAIRQSQPLVVSLAAGVAIADITRWLDGYSSIVRSMPNTPALVKSGATGLYAHASVGFEQRNQAESVLRAVGLTVWVENESLLDVVTALSGSGPAYFFLFMEAMETAAVQLGLAPQTARILTQQTALGASRLAIESDEAPAQLREKVTSPGGTTEQAIRVFEESGLRATVEAAIRAAQQKAVELSQGAGVE